MRHREFSGCRKHGLQRRLSPMGASAANWRLKIRMDDQAGLLCSGGIGQAECVRSMGLIAPPARRVVCVVLRLAYDPLPTPLGSLRRHNLRPLLAAFLDVAHREPLGLNSLLRVLLSHLECIWFWPTRQANGSPRYLTPQALASTCALPAPSRFSCLACRSGLLWRPTQHKELAFW